MVEGFRNMNPENVLDLWGVMNEVVGSVWLAIGIGLAVLNVYAIKKKAPFNVIMIFDILLLIAFFAKAQLEIIWVFIGLGIGVLFYLAVAKKINQ